MRRLLSSSVLLLSCIAATAQVTEVSGMVSIPDTVSMEWGVCYAAQANGRSTQHKFTVRTPFKWKLRSSDTRTLLFVLPGHEDKIVDISTRTGRVDLGEIAMVPDDKLLDAATVSAEGTSLKFDMGNVSLDVAGDSLLRRMNLKDVLSRLPLVSVSPETRAINVSTGRFAVTINGRKNLALNSTNIDYITELLKGENVQSVSLDTSPTGRYGMYAAVIDIRVKEELTDFIAGLAGAYFTDAYNINGALGLTVKTGKAVTELSYKPAYTDSRQTQNSSIRTSIDNPDKTFAAYDTVKTAVDREHRLALNSSYNIGAKDVMFLNAEAKRNDADGLTTSSFADSFTSTDSDKDATDIGATLSWQHDFKSGREKLLTLQGGFTDKRTSYDRSINGIRNDNDTRASEWSAGVDFSHKPTNRFSYYITTGYRQRQYRSESGGTVLLNYPQRTVFCNGNIAYRCGKFSLQALGSYDRTKDLTAYGNLDYHIVAIYFPRTGQSVRLAAGRSIFRPDIKWLNTYEDNSTAGSTLTGNSSIRPDVTNSLLAGYSYMLGRRFQLNATATYRWSDNGAFREATISDDGRLMSTYVNTNGRRSLRIGGGMTWNPTDGISLSVDPRCAWNRYLWPGGDIRNFEYGVRFKMSAKLPHELELFANGTYDNPDVSMMADAQAVKLHNIFHMDFGLSKQLKKCRAYIRMDRPWQSYETAVREMEASGYNILNSTRQPVVRIRAGITWNFGDFSGKARRNMREFRATDNQRN